MKRENLKKLCEQKMRLARSCPSWSCPCQQLVHASPALGMALLFQSALEEFLSAHNKRMRDEADEETEEAQSVEEHKDKLRAALLSAGKFVAKKTIVIAK